MVVYKPLFADAEFIYANQFRVVRFKIPAVAGSPTCYMWKPYVRVDSHVTELTKYPDWMRVIYMSKVDWSAQLIEDASLDDLDADAIRLAREGYRQRFPAYADEMLQWDDKVFLDKANLTQDGSVTRAAMLLVGKKERSYKLDHIAQLVWKCYQDGQVFGDTFSVPLLKQPQNC